MFNIIAKGRALRRRFFPTAEDLINGIVDIELMLEEEPNLTPERRGNLQLAQKLLNRRLDMLEGSDGGVTGNIAAFAREFRRAFFQTKAERREELESGLDRCTDRLAELIQVIERLEALKTKAPEKFAGLEPQLVELCSLRSRLTYLKAGLENDLARL